MIKIIKSISFCTLLIFCFTTIGYTQHRGDNLAFQGLGIPIGNGVKALAMGGAYTSISGDINSIFWNPAGLASIEGLQLSIGANFYQKMSRENQVYRPNRQFVTMSFILDGLYAPNPAYNGELDHVAFLEDSTYIVNEPLSGKDVYSKEAADWERNNNGSDLNYITAALPFKLADKSFAVSGAYNKKYQVLNYDRNQTHLYPHVGYIGYEGQVDRVTDPAESTRVYWSDYVRERTGDIQSIAGAVAVELTENIKLGLGFNIFSGETDDTQILSRVAYFDLVNNNQFRFSYDTLGTRTTGISEFSAVSFNIGTILDFERFSLGLKIVSPYTLTRKWEYTTVTFDPINSTTTKSSGEDKMEIPMSFAVGLSFKPVKQFRIALDFESTKYSKSNFTLANQDTTHRNWVDQSILSV
jgi:hypothetical protein